MRFYEKNPKGHIWKKNDYNDEIDIFAYDIQEHNGPECIICGYSFCHHCVTKSRYMEKCSVKRKDKIQKLLNEIDHQKVIIEKLLTTIEEILKGR